MRQRSSPPSDPSTTLGLHPVLQAALDSLDVELEEELTRYRRQRYRQAKYGKHVPIWQPAKEPESRSPQLPLMDNAARTEPIVPAEAPAEPPAQPNLAPELAAVSLSAPLPSLSNPAAFSTATPFLSNYPEMHSGDRTLDRLRELAIAATSRTEAAIGFQTEVPQAEYPEVEPLAMEPPQWQDLPRSDFSSGFSESPDDYLESTEELLQSIAEEPHHSPVERESSLLNSLLTPLGIGSMVLLLLSSATLGYVIMHPSSLDLLSPTQTQTSSDSQGTGDSTSKPLTSSQIPDSPNLAAEEFVDLNVDNLSTIPGAAPAAGTASPSSVAGGQGRSLLPATSPTASTTTPSQSNEQSGSSSAPIAPDTAPNTESTSSAAVDSAPAPLPEPEPAVSQPEPEMPAPANESSTLPAIDPPAPEAAIPEPAAPEATAPEAPPEVATAPTSPTSTTGTYYVVTPYNGDPSLEQAREAVPDAYVRNFESGANVQLGVFGNAENAQELVQELEAKGIAAEVYQP